MSTSGISPAKTEEKNNIDPKNTRNLLMIAFSLVYLIQNRLNIILLNIIGLRKNSKVKAKNVF
ncbi:TPA: hypothetical protein JBD21_01195 [Legionella pneumophila subsp. pneumophila]|uniref:Uncharacterized protein n=1 Tax=Legionella pneumophila subsp. pneumophila TaxID=91891 RepID=A0A3A6V501_LEGPN|nr:hypothetical protein C3929_13210 [Legionella pneumophila]RJY27893.1 hypothetical protein D1H99_01785 [Legionella pneumophila subsp. pneumophila]PYB50203.1 hypothetical protein DM453_01205 [Legionella pneumophila]PYB67284.1 hypothetical protein DMC17_01205 [Legionella pneumophila]RJY30466.1 hypothetical protein D1I00_02765 [Legionella pneumophila subsp. pneumophila]